MPCYVYILYAASLDQYYVGHTVDLKVRIYRHTPSGNKSTRKAGDWQFPNKDPMLPDLRLIGVKGALRKTSAGNT